MYTPTIGLEIHVELKTRAKMFCSCKNAPHEEVANTHICPVCLAYPGALPTLNKEAIKKVLTVGSAINGTLADYTEFDRKSYFYPDIPKGYQISQYASPLVLGGNLAGVSITRVHLEEDTARSSHQGNYSLLDFNRSGVPLMELVTEPVIHTPREAGTFARELQLLLRTLEVSDANLEKGEMRIEANISVSPNEQFGTKVEVKNLNSFRSVELAIAYEIDRQIRVLEEGGKISQETRGWNEQKEETFHQRFKEGSADYRYFSDPDLVSFYVSSIPDFSGENLTNALPELPESIRTRYASLGINPGYIEFFLAEKNTRLFFDDFLLQVENKKELVILGANYLISDLKGVPGEITSVEFAELIRMITNEEVSSRGAKDTLLYMKEKGGSVRSVVDILQVRQINDPGMLVSFVEEVLKEDQETVEMIRSGKESAVQRLIGMVIKKTNGRANPQLVAKMIKESISV